MNDIYKTQFGPGEPDNPFTEPETPTIPDVEPDPYPVTDPVPSPNPEPFPRPPEPIPEFPPDVVF